ncbi:MAG: biotin--[acetyl-CoA-carboxylase] ligase [Kiritimatiellae bacterium]|nr:biotin--[acetyl-CoA-carboxylase] ligase [Kiritimatiellia bacterium]
MVESLHHGDDGRFAGLLDAEWSERLASSVGPGVIGRPIHAFRSIDSTNSEVKLLARRGADEGLVIVAAEQSAGRGRMGRTWISPADKGVYMSVLMRPSWPASDAGWLAIIGGVAVAETLRSRGIQGVTIKWPNDVLVNGRKIAGVLVEPSLKAGRIEFAVVGIGLNLGHEESDLLGMHLEERATSCEAEGTPLDRDDCIVGLIATLNQTYAAACGHERGRLLEAWAEMGGTRIVPSE